MHIQITVIVISLSPRDNRGKCYKVYTW